MSKGWIVAMMIQLQLQSRKNDQKLAMSAENNAVILNNKHTDKSENLPHTQFDSAETINRVYFFISQCEKFFMTKLHFLRLSGVGSTFP